jgi:hypothetical protein
VLRDLPAREARRRWVPRRPSATVRLVAGLAAAAALIVPTLLPRRDGDRASRSPTPTPVPSSDADAIAVARARNVEAYAREKARLHRDLVGKWVVIAERDPASVEGAYKPVVVGETLDAVAGLALDLPHRFVFRVGEDGDEDVFVSSWYAPRFAGHGIATALGMQVVMHGAVDVSKDGRSASFRGPTPFPRVAFHLAAPDGTASPRNGEATPEVFVGSVGPDLMLTPQDAAELRLARWEVPGTVVVGGVPCRRVRVTASVPAVGASGSVVACVPDVPAADLVQASRGRHMFWQWAPSLRDDLALDRDPLGAPLGDASTDERWIVFGNDRVLGRGTTVPEALAAADTFRDVVYHRYLTPWPMRAASESDDERAVDAVVEIGTSRFEARVPPMVWWDPAKGGPEVARARSAVLPVLVPRMTEAEWIAAGLALAEDPSPDALPRPEPPGRGPIDPPVATRRTAYALVSAWPKHAPDARRSAVARVTAYVVPR